MSRPDEQTVSGMRIDWDVPIEMDDGVVIRADVYRPDDDGRYPVILSYGPYGKWLHFADGSPRQWQRLLTEHPDVAAGSANTFACYEVVDPETWVPDGYVCVRVDSRGAGRSPGFLEPWSPRETRDLYECIEWAGTAGWSNGKVGLSGISYYAINQWLVAALQPPSLAAMCVWEGASDLYRELAYHGGIHCTFGDLWYRGRVVGLQHGLAERGAKSRFTGDLVTGPDALSEVALQASRVDFGRDLLAHPLIDDYWKLRITDLSRIQVPLLSAANLGGAGLHLRGNVEGFLRAASEEKWLELHGLEHWTHFYTDYGVRLQKRFFGHFLKGEDTGWQDQPRVLLQVRHPGDRFEARAESEWPLARTVWTRWFLAPDHLRLVESPPDESGARDYGAPGEGLTFLSDPLPEDTELTGPVACKLFVSTDADDVDLFVVLRVFTADIAEITFQGANEPNVTVAQGWLRGSHRALDPTLSAPYRPYHTHEATEPLTPGEIYELDVEVWPTSVVIPSGCRIGLTIRGRDYLHPGQATHRGRDGVGPFPFRHDRRRDRHNGLSGRVTIHTGPNRASHVLLPVIPRE